VKWFKDLRVLKWFLGVDRFWGVYSCRLADTKHERKKDTGRERGRDDSD